MINRFLLPIHSCLKYVWSQFSLSKITCQLQHCWLPVVWGKQFFSSSSVPLLYLKPIKSSLPLFDSQIEVEHWSGLFLNECWHLPGKQLQLFNEGSASLTFWHVGNAISVSTLSFIFVELKEWQEGQSLSRWQCCWSFCLTRCKVIGFVGCKA